MQDIVDFAAGALGCPPSRVRKLDAFPGNTVYEVDERLIVKASTNHDALRAEAWACARAGAAGCATPAIIRFGHLDSGASALIMNRVKGQPISAEHPALNEVAASLRRLHTVTLPGFGWLAEGSPKHPSWLSFLGAICDGTKKLAPDVADAAESAIDERADALGAIETGVLCHGDLKAAHILVDDERLAGVIDWGDALVADPWFDIARFAHRSPAASLKLLLDGYGATTEEWRLPLYEALWMLVDANIAHGHGHRVDATLRAAMAYLTAEPQD